jgi:3-polyprenyl-4-hydroxybenzoate decarboxylase
MVLWGKIAELLAKLPVMKDFPRDPADILTTKLHWYAGHAQPVPAHAAAKGVASKLC